MKKGFAILLIIPTLLGCGEKLEVVFTKIKLNDKFITLRNPFYKYNNIVYSDSQEISSYLGGNSFNYSSEQGVAMIGFVSGFIITIKRNSKIVIKAVTPNQIVEYNLSEVVREKTTGFDIPVDDYMSILEYNHTIENGVYVIKK